MGGGSTQRENAVSATARLRIRVSGGVQGVGFRYFTQRKAHELGLVGYWRFDEGAGDVAFDATGNGNNGRLGTSVGVDAWDPQWTSVASPIP